MKLDEEQIYHLIDLLEINIADKMKNPPFFMDKNMLNRSIEYDKEIIKILEGIKDEKR